ncbi:MAG: glycoside hydrolase family 3 N-terminal domain-containing protein, partial [Oscillospiraceae bacterium]
QNTGVELIDLRGKDFDDPLWEDLLDAMDMDELALLMDECGYCTPEMKSINKPKVTDLDGPAGLNLVVGHGSVPIGEGKKAMTWCSEYMLASTWEEDYAFKMGEGIGEDGLYGEVEGWYGPAVNIHRTPFAGRNFEYYSEDSFISGVFGYQAVNGAATKGMYAFLKHFALNDQETHRDHLGLITWADEQTIREIYLKPFEMTLTDNTVTIKYNENVAKDASGNPDYENPEYVLKETEVNAATGLMSSFNRIGTTWAGGNYNLLTEVLRNEWGSNCFVLTDYEVSSYMHTDQSLPAGGDGKLKTVGLAGNMLYGYTLEGKPNEQVFAREAAHRILYTVVNSAGMNGYVHGMEYVNGFAYYKIIIIAWDVLAAAGIGVLVFFLVKKIRRNLRLKNGE